MKYSLYYVLPLLVVSTGCLQTRSDIAGTEEKKVMQSQVTELQRTKADQEAQSQVLEANVRQLNGRIESLEHQNQTLVQERNALKEQVTLLEDRLKNTEQAILLLQQAMQTQAPAASSSSVSESKPKAKAKSALEEGDEHLKAKEWKKAIAAYQKFRETHTKGALYTEATYKIGVCFQELKMNREARVFYEEVIDRAPKSKLAKAATYRLNQIKKK